jgi:hypothetical protein
VRWVIMAVLLTGSTVLALNLSTAQADPPPPPGDLHIKSRLGWMPPAYGMPHAERALAAFSSSLFDPFILYPSGSWPEAVTVGEWTGDGRTDVALSTSFDSDPASDQHIHLFAQDDGTLTRVDRQATGVMPLALDTGDLNRDGLDDLVVVNGDDDTLGIFIQSVPGIFDGMLTAAAGVAPDAVVVGDFDTDLYDDVAVAHAVSQTVAIYFQRPDGSFSPPTFLPVSSSGFNDLDRGDLNHDGRDDLVLLRGAGCAADHVAIFCQEGDSLGPPVYLTAETGSFQAHGLAVGDVTGDGRDDVVVTAGGNTPNAFLDVFPQQPDGTMAVTPTVYAARHLPGAVEIGDVNHDGRNDVTVVHDAWLSLSTYLQNVTGTLDAYVGDSLPRNDFYRPGGLDLADVSGDGSLDILIATHGAKPEQTGLVALTNATGTAPTSTITTPALGDLVSDMDATHYPIEGLASADAVTLEISTDGGLTWQSRPAETSWSYRWALPIEDGVHVVLVRAIDAGGRVQSPPARTRIIVNRRATLYLPLVMDNYVGPGPDLIVEDLIITPDDVHVIIKNQGDRPVVDEFWVDVYIAPDPVPTAVNQTWQMIADEGIVWGVEADALPLQPGDALVLTIDGDYYTSTLSHVAWPLEVGTSVYAQVDSAKAGSDHGAVLENHEISGSLYNNIVETVVMDIEGELGNGSEYK